MIRYLYSIIVSVGLCIFIKIFYWEIFQENKTITLEQVDTAGQVILHCRHYGCNAECGNPSILLNPMHLVERDGVFVIATF